MAKKKKPKGKLRRVKVSEIRQGPIQHSEGLDPFLTAWVRNLYERVGNLMYPSFEPWELGFMRDATPISEIAVWEAIARAYETHIEKHPEADKQKTVAALAALTSGGAFKTPPPHLEELRALIQRFGDEVFGDTKRTVLQMMAKLGSEVENNPPNA